MYHQAVQSMSHHTSACSCREQKDQEKGERREKKKMIRGDGMRCDRMEKNESWQRVLIVHTPERSKDGDAARVPEG